MGKMIKRTAAAFLAVCLSVLCFSFAAFAAEGTLQFSDPQTEAGATVTVTAKVSAGGAALGDIDITATYDTSLLRFESGTNVTGSDGTLTLSYKGDGTATEAAFSMEFTALKEGNATIQVGSNTAYLYSDETLNLDLGTSTVTIQGGTPVTDEKSTGGGSNGTQQVEVNGKTYTVNEKFSEAVVPNGFTATEIQLDGKMTKAMVQEASGKYLFYLEDEAGDSDYFLFSMDNGSFSQTEVVDVNGETSIYLMEHEDKEGLPEEYQETTIDIGGKVFSAWQNTSNQDYYLVYALSSNGTEGYYQYDTMEGTYQRYEVPMVQKEEKSDNALLDKMLSFLEAHLVVVMCAVWGAFLLLLIFIIVLGVKLSHRNQELDELYDEYDIDGAESVSKGKKVSGKKTADFDDENEDFDEEYEDDFEDDGFEDDDDFSEYDDEYEDDYDEYEDEDYNDDFDDDIEDDDFEEVYDRKPTRKGKQNKDDDFSMNFIDI